MLVLRAVHKRGAGNPDPRAHAAAVAGGTGGQPKKARTSPATAMTTLEVVAAMLPTAKRKAAAIAARKGTTNCSTSGSTSTSASGKEVVHRNPPSSSSSPSPPGDSNVHGPSKHEQRMNNKKKKNTMSKMSLRLQSLLRDDTGEQEMEMFPDSSPEAAQQLADLKTYNKLNEEARRKANNAVSHVEGEEEEEDNHDDDEDDNDEEESEQDDGDGEGGNMKEDGDERAGGLGMTQRRRRRRRREVRNDVRKQHTDVGEPLPPTSNYDQDKGRVTLLVRPNPSPSYSSPKTMRVRATVKETGSDSISTYIKSLGQHELLYKEDEVLLGRQVRILSQLEETRHELELQLLRPPTFAQWADATNHTVPSLKRQIRKSQRAKAALVEANLRLVITVARQSVKKSYPSSSLKSSSQSASSVQFQDACQSGILGLTRATEKFDPDLGFRFSTYATWWIRKEVARNVCEQSRSVRIPPSAMKIINDIYIQERVLMAELGRRPREEELADRVGMSVKKLNFYQQSAKEVKSLDKKIDARSGKGSMSTGGDGGDGATMDIFVRDTEHASPTELVNEAMLKDEIRRLVGTLSPREQVVIRLRFGLDEGSEPLGLADISVKFGVEKEQIRKIEAKALLKLRQPSRSQVVRCYVSDLA